MKGFPNQVSDLATLGAALKVLADLNEEGQNPKDDGVLGEALIRRGVLGTGHNRIPLDRYLAQQKARTRKSDQSFRTRARGLREFFRILGLIDDTGADASVTPAGRQIAALAGTGFTREGIRLWRRVILKMTHDGGDGERSHPYQVLLRLVAKRPRITRAKCALALEARNDSEDELDRIVGLSDLDQETILDTIGVTKANWDNAKKILPRLAEQLGDVQKLGDEFVLSDAPGVLKEWPGQPEVARAAKGARKPRSSTRVTALSIAKSGTPDYWDEGADLAEAEVDPEALRAGRAKGARRLNRHNAIVQKMALMLEAEGAELFENPFDCLACFPDEGLLIEAKSLDGSQSDETARVREALSQLLYYQSFVTRPLVKKRAVRKVACFEDKISDAHLHWLEASDIHVIWNAHIGFDGTEHAKEELSGHFGF